MAQKKYYAVRKGLVPGVYRTWAECERQVKGFSGASYKSFLTLEEAEAFACASDALDGAPKDGVVAYVDGSYDHSTKTFSYGMVVLRDGREYTFNGKYDNPELVSMRNVAGEIMGAQAAMEYAVREGLDAITIYHDYEGIAKWPLGEWKTNKSGTKAYKEYYRQASTQVKIRFVKVEGHSGDTYNDMADALAKQALGLA